jgi:hypothetical protein
MFDNRYFRKLRMGPQAAKDFVGSSTFVLENRLENKKLPGGR